MLTYCESIVLILISMGPPAFWNVHFLLGVLHFLLNPILSSTDSASFIRRTKNYPPSFVPTTINITVRQGELARLPCSVRNLGTRKVAWRRLEDNQVLTVGKITWVKDKRVMVEHKTRHEGVSDWYLLIKSVEPDDSGVYECQLTAKKRHSLNITLTVTGPPLRVPGITITGNKYPNLGEEIRLTCIATGGPHIPEDIDWFKEGDKIDSVKYPKIAITKYRKLDDKSLVSELIIDHSQVADNGMYICRSSDEEIESRKVTVIVADTKNTKRVPRPVPDSKTRSNVHGKYRTPNDTDDPEKRVKGSATSGLLLKGSAWITLFVSMLLYPLSMHVI